MKSAGVREREREKAHVVGVLMFLALEPQTYSVMWSY